MYNIYLTLSSPKRCYTRTKDFWDKKYLSKGKCCQRNLKIILYCGREHVCCDCKRSQIRLNQSTNQSINQSFFSTYRLAQRLQNLAQTRHIKQGYKKTAEKVPILSHWPANLWTPHFCLSLIQYSQGRINRRPSTITCCTRSRDRFDPLFLHMFS